MALAASNLFTWKDSYKVGIAKIDAQHYTLVSLLNKLHQAMMEGKDRAALTGILDDLIGYTKIHFGTEEQLMQKNSYPGFAKHRAEHASLANKVLAFRRDFQAGKVALSIELMRFLKDWLKSHILGSDMQYSPFFRERGVR